MLLKTLEVNPSSAVLVPVIVGIIALLAGFGITILVQFLRGQNASKQAKKNYKRC